MRHCACWFVARSQLSVHFHGVEFFSVSSIFWGHGSLLKSSAGRALPVPAASGTCGVSRPLFKDPKISVGHNFRCCQLNTKEKGQPQTSWSPTIGATFLRLASLQSQQKGGTLEAEAHICVYSVFPALFCSVQRESVGSQPFVGSP